MLFRAKKPILGVSILAKLPSQVIDEHFIVLHMMIVVTDYSTWCPVDDYSDVGLELWPFSYSLI